MENLEMTEASEVLTNNTIAVSDKTNYYDASDEKINDTILTPDFSKYQNSKSMNNLKLLAGYG